MKQLPLLDLHDTMLHRPLFLPNKHLLWLIIAPTIGNSKLSFTRGMFAGTNYNCIFNKVEMENTYNNKIRLFSIIKYDYQLRQIVP